MFLFLCLVCFVSFIVRFVSFCVLLSLFVLVGVILYLFVTNCVLLCLSVRFVFIGSLVSFCDELALAANLTFVQLRPLFHIWSLLALKTKMATAKMQTGGFRLPVLMKRI